MYVTLAEVKALLNIQDTEKDTQISTLLPATGERVNRALGVSSLLTGEKTEETYFSNSGQYFLVHFPLAEAEPFTFNGEALETIVYSSSVSVEPGLVSQVGNKVKIKFTAGYSDVASVPTDIKYAQAMMIAEQIGIAPGLSGAITEYSIGPESVKYA